MFPLKNLARKGLSISVRPPNHLFHQLSRSHLNSLTGNVYISHPREFSLNTTLSRGIDELEGQFNKMILFLNIKWYGKIYGITGILFVLSPYTYKFINNRPVNADPTFHCDIIPSFEIA